MVLNGLYCADVPLSNYSLTRSGADSKLGLSMVRLSLQLAPEPPAFDLPPITEFAPDHCGNEVR